MHTLPIVARVVLGVVFLAGEMIFMFYAMHLGNLIFMATNAHLPPERQYSVYHWGFDRLGWHRRLRADYRRFYPDGDLIRRMWIAQACGFACVVGLIATISTPWR